ncbi:MAG: hypothetical protein PVSMB8_11640 [Vulcanimicrobiaceae bacterium]
MPRLRLVLVSIFALSIAVATAARAADESCQQAYVVPYAEQCGFGYKSLHGDTSPKNLTAAFDACGRAQNVAVGCLKTTDRHLHAIALGALYQDVTRQAEIAVFAQQFGVAKALLQEKLQILDVVAHDGKPGDAAVPRERAATKTDLADTTAGLCTQTALAGAGPASELARARKFGELATFLKRKSGEYGACARQAPSLPKRAYLEYVGIVALEEGARAEQASGRASGANADYRACVAEAGRIARYARAPVTTYLTTIRDLCTGRLHGTYGVDQPAPLAAPQDKGFRPLALPSKR